MMSPGVLEILSKQLVGFLPRPANMRLECLEPGTLVFKRLIIPGIYYTASKNRFQQPLAFKKSNTEANETANVSMTKKTYMTCIPILLERAEL